jgi:hypothetical protein
MGAIPCRRIVCSSPDCTARTSKELDAILDNILRALMSRGSTGDARRGRQATSEFVSVADAVFALADERVASICRLPARSRSASRRCEVIDAGQRDIEHLASSGIRDAVVTPVFDSLPISGHNAVVRMTHRVLGIVHSCFGLALSAEQGMGIVA